ncbi:hypothetical protein ACFFX1_14695 [Dactylosporangium sucinum]|uniref:DUF3592 domain-containing protein n=1 Tax=Dactylosporangium sucinum TaxID=1424081 RepID=A0A917UA06_9ACTN|nr:hypothetical protein [Dactylosporangium sucinum]GGM69370.1 hypothetical protein GCM10007977_083870 [Dactylosporangium sucinum]
MSNDGASDTSGLEWALAGAILGLLLFLFGVWQVRTLTWEKATATVGDCGYSRKPSAKSSGNRYCAVIWQSGGRQHSAHMPADQDMAPGAQKTVFVNGDEASVGPGLWGSGSCCCGAVVLLIAGPMAWRLRRS